MRSPFTYHAQPKRVDEMLLAMRLPLGSPPAFGLGVDIARFGSNHSCAFLTHQNWVFGGARWQGMDTFQSAAIIAALVNEWEQFGWVCTYLCIDVIGVGGGTTDALWNSGARFRELLKPINVSLAAMPPKPEKISNARVAVGGGDGASASDVLLSPASSSPRFFNARSELAWNLRMEFRLHYLRLLTNAFSGRDDIGLPNWLVAKLKKQCTTLKYENDERRAGGAILVQSKDDYRDENDGDSPDEFDALALTRNKRFVGLERRKGMAQSHNIFGR